ncbi:MAG TPA: carboxypeptidase regulatory-like domain-containing protein [Planctomycetaceae bacterium]|nr:carboxypeptidase regulatory-like domain-containing protein [Planctomycetaceae bacterium]
MKISAWLTARLLPAGMALALAASAIPAQAADGYGTLKGTIKFDGAAPHLEPVVAKGKADVKDAAVCAAAPVPNEELVVNSENNGIQNVFVYLKKATKIHPDLQKSAKPDVTFDQKGCRFLPHALVVRTDQNVKVLSDDPIAHNTHTYPIRNKPANTVIKADDRVGVPFAEPQSENLPFQVKCDFHSWMNAYWLVLDHPYAAVTDKDGNFTIEKLPAGDYEFVIWQEKAGYLDRKYKAKITADKTTTADLKYGAAKFMK